MKIEKREHTLADQKGNGTFVRNGQDLGSVEYSLRVTQEVHYLSGSSGLEPVPGLLSGQGTFRSTGPALSVTEGEELILRSEDGRERVVQIVTSFWGESGSFQLTQASAEEFDPERRRPR